jgi:hypothetical protein
LIPLHAFRGFLLSKGRFTRINFPGANLTIATGINSAGQIVGAYREREPTTGSEPTTGRLHGFVLSGGVFSTIDVPGAIDTYALGISPRGDVVGQYKAADGRHGFVMTGNTFSTTDFPGGSEAPGPSNWPFKQNAAYGVNIAGSIVGQYQGADTKLHGYRLSLNCGPDELLPTCMAHEDLESSLTRFSKVAAALHNAGVVSANVDILGHYFAQALGRPAPTPELYGIPAAGQPGRDTQYSLDQWWSMMRAHRLIGLHAPSNATR